MLTFLAGSQKMKRPVKEKATGEKYKSKAAMMKHEKREGPAERKKEYGSKTKRYAKGGMVKKGC